MTNTVCFLLLFAAALCCAAPASAQQPMPGAKPAPLSPAEAQRTLDVLQNPAERDRMIETLRAIAKAAPPVPHQPETKPEQPVTLAPGSLGAQLLVQLSAGAERLADDAGAAARAFTDFPQLRSWGSRVAGDPEERAAAVNGIWQLALILVGALVVERFAAAAMRRPIAALTAHAPENGPENGNAADVWVCNHRGVTWRLLRRLPFALARLFLDLIPVAVFVGIAALLAGMVPGATTRAVTLAIAEAYAITRVVISLGRMLVSPAIGRLRLFQIGDAQAEYLMRWLRRTAIVAVWGGALAQISLLLGLDPRIDDTLMRLVALIVAVLLGILVFRTRHAVADYLRQSPRSEGGPSRWRSWLAGAWLHLAIITIGAGWIFWAAGIRNGINGVRILIGTVLVLVAARLAAVILLGIIDRAAHPSAELSRRFPGLGARIARYRAPVRILVDLLIAVSTAIVLLQLWGANSFIWFEEGRIGARLFSALATIALAAVVAIMVWEGANAELERRLALMSDAGSAAHAARLRTLLPMLRASLLAAILAVVGLTALSEIGINVGPLLAGAGIVGVAVGFGSQRLVQDVITGMFALFENALQVGESVTVAGLSGKVEDLSIRAIWLRGGDGAIHIVPFSAVTTISNSSRGLGNAELSVTVATKEDSDKVSATLRDIAADMRRDPDFAPLMLGDLEVWVNAVKAEGVTLAGKIACTPAGREPVGHEFTRRMQKRFQELGIELAAG